jgi:hypothetical protein
LERQKTLRRNLYLRKWGIMRMFAEYVDRSGEVMARTEAEVTKEADLADLVGSLGQQFRELYPERTLQADIGKARCMIRMGAVDATSPSLAPSTLDSGDK